YEALDAQPDWGDVAGRAARGRRRSVVLAILACFALAVFVSAAFAFGTDLWQLVAGKPVSTKRLSPEEQRMFASLASGRPILRTQPNDPALRRLGKDVSVRRLADQGGYTFYVIEVRGRYPTRCFATGRAWKPRLFGSMECPIPGRRPEPGSFPSARNPVLDQSEFAPRGGKVSRLVGFAAVAVKKVGLGALVQRGKSQGVSVSVYDPGVAIFDLSAASPRVVKRLGAGVSAGCLRTRFLNGRWLSDDLSSGALGRGGDRLRVDLVGGGGFMLPDEVPPPYQGCEISGYYGRRWNDAFGTRALVEIPLSEAGRHFFNDRAAARDLAYFVRSGRVQRVRLSPSPRPGLEALARRYPHRVVELQRKDQFAPEDKIGFWIGPGTIRFTTTSSTGRRLFVVAKRRTLKLPSQNLGDLAFVF